MYDFVILHVRSLFCIVFGISATTYRIIHIRASIRNFICAIEYGNRKYATNCFAMRIGSCISAIPSYDPTTTLVSIRTFSETSYAPRCCVTHERSIEYTV